MPNPIAPERFLYGTFGYERIRAFIEGRKDKSVSLRKHLEGTILGTIGRRSSPAVAEWEEWRQNYSTVPRIFSCSELDDQIRKGKSYLEDVYGVDISPEIRKRQFFLSNYTVFVGLTGKGVQALLEEVHRNEFPQAEHHFETRGRFKGHTRDEDFYLFTEGSMVRSGAKLIVVAFNSNQDIIDDINGLCSRYTYLTNNYRPPVTA